jgi:hypothetical protein
MSDSLKRYIVTRKTSLRAVQCSGISDIRVIRGQMKITKRTHRTEGGQKETDPADKTRILEFTKRSQC